MVTVNNSEVNEWKEAVIDACVINCITWYEEDPRRTIHELCGWEAGVALDPRVSSDAQKLIDDTIDRCKEQIGFLLTGWSKLSLIECVELKEHLYKSLIEMKGKHDGIR